MKKTLPVILLILSLTACSPRPEAEILPVLGETPDLSVLVGEWWGEYSSVDTGRSGQIRFSLEAGVDMARGDVLMLPALGQDARDESAPTGSSTRPVDQPFGGRTLGIEFVRVRPEDETVTGTLERYEDPACDCIVSTTFIGRVSTDRIEGTFETKGGPGYHITTGRWRVDRKDS